MASIVAMLTDAANELEAFVEHEKVDGDADIAQRRPGEIKRDVEQEQRQLERVRTSVEDGSASVTTKQINRRGDRNHCVE